ncbi:hypothetical protein BV22DRAFT_1025182, partial [Leucogyrophana mollusca]
DAVQDEPVKIWSTLASIHVQERPGTRFNAWGDFFSIRKKEDESLSSLIARIEDSMSKVQELRPKDASKPYTLADLDAELVCMTMIRSLPEEYDHFASSLMLLKSLDKQELKSAFLAEETQRRRHADGPGALSSDSALATGSGQCRCGPNVTCFFCERPGHCTHKCRTMQRHKDSHKAQMAEERSKQRSKNASKAQDTSSSANSSSTPSTLSNSTSAASLSPGNSSTNLCNAQSITEFAGNASFRSSDPSNPLCVEAQRAIGAK